MKEKRTPKTAMVIERENEFVSGENSGSPVVTAGEMVHRSVTEITLADASRVDVSDDVAALRNHRDSYSRRHWADDVQSSGCDPSSVFAVGLRHHHLANTAYPIAHRKTIWDYRCSESEHEGVMKCAFGATKRMSLYIHIPFCERRCSFCEYTVVDGHDSERESLYMAALLRELSLYDDLLTFSGKELVGCDIGGGTPSIMEPRRIAQLVDRVTSMFRLSPSFAFSIETTPKIAALHPEKLRAIRSCGIERISMGLQMVNPRLLREYGRDLNLVSHNERALENIRAAGFKQVNIDLMYGFARQTVDDVHRSVAYAARLSPDFMTLYRMRYKGTKVRGEADRIDLSSVMAMYHAARSGLAAAGYWAPPGQNGFSRCVSEMPTSAYLTERVRWSTPYLGIGLGSQTFTNTVLAYNDGAATKRLEGYLESVSAGRLPIQDLYLLPKSEAMAKMISVSFYFGRIELAAFEAVFGCTLEDRFAAEIAFVLERGLMEYRDGGLQLTEAGADVFNGVIALFYSDRVKRWLLSKKEEEGS